VSLFTLPVTISDLTQLQTGIEFFTNSNKQPPRLHRLMLEHAPCIECGRDVRADPDATKRKTVENQVNGASRWLDRLNRTLKARLWAYREPASPPLSGRRTTAYLSGSVDPLGRQDCQAMKQLRITENLRYFRANTR
jgi:hypothetical protein